MSGIKKVKEAEAADVTFEAAAAANKEDVESGGNREERDSQLGCRNMNRQSTACLM
jgi:hypothetical protein